MSIVDGKGMSGARILRDCGERWQGDELRAEKCTQRLCGPAKAE